MPDGVLCSAKGANYNLSELYPELRVVSEKCVSTIRGCNTKTYTNQLIFKQNHNIKTCVCCDTIIKIQAIT